MSGQAGQWQSMVVECRGSRVKVAWTPEGGRYGWRSYLYADHPGLARERGYIGLQYHSGVEFRRIVIEPRVK